MRIVPTNMTIADYCLAMDRQEIVVNRDYQRRDEVWPQQARSYLIETVMLGFPMPKFSLYQITEAATRMTYKEIVDGQQRSKTIKDFYSDRLKLSRTLETVEIAGRIYSDLDEELQKNFLDYQLSIDLYVAARPEEIREVFRRMNSYTVPLNYEEQRHANYQGPFKWFVQRIAGKYSGSFKKIGLFTDRQLIRMADTKLVAEICHAILKGIQTTNPKALGRLYKEFDEEFLIEDALEEKLLSALDTIVSWSNIHNTALMKHYQIYSLSLAVIHQLEPIEQLQPRYESDGADGFDEAVASQALSRISDALEDPEGHAELAHFVEASSRSTNTGENRAMRFITYSEALATAKIK